MPFDADDLAAFNDPDMPGYALALVGGVPVHGRFRGDYAEVLGMSGTGPAFSAAAADLAGVVVGAAVMIGADVYTVAEIKRPDPVGRDQTRLILESAA